MKIKKALPKFILSNSLKKNELTNAILNDFKNLKKISNIVHPLVRKKLNNFLIKKKKKLVILDIPLFIENKLNKKNDILVYIEAKKTDIQKKLKKKEKTLIKKDIAKFKTYPVTLEQKKKISNFIIINNFRIKSVQKDIIIIKKKF